MPPLDRQIAPVLPCPACLIFYSKRGIASGAAGRAPDGGAESVRDAHSCAALARQSADHRRRSRQSQGLMPTEARDCPAHERTAKRAVLSLAVALARFKSRTRASKQASAGEQATCRQHLKLGARQRHETEGRAQSRAHLTFGMLLSLMSHSWWLAWPPWHMVVIRSSGRREALGKSLAERVAAAAARTRSFQGRSRTSE